MKITYQYADWDVTTQWTIDIIIIESLIKYNLELVIMFALILVVIVFVGGTYEQSTKSSS